MPAKWIVDVKGAPHPTNASFEISVLRSDYPFGQESWGWFDDRKLWISSDGGPSMANMTDRVWNKLLVLAQEVANELNKEEGLT